MYVCGSVNLYASLVLCVVIMIGLQSEVVLLPMFLVFILSSGFGFHGSVLNQETSLADSNTQKVAEYLTKLLHFFFLP